jgi:hypothetical protein
MQRFAGGRNVMLATGGAVESPSAQNPNVHWIFSTSLLQHELTACSRRRELPTPESVRLIIVCRQEVKDRDSH